MRMSQSWTLPLRRVDAVLKPIESPSAGPSSTVVQWNAYSGMYTPCPGSRTKWLAGGRTGAPFSGWPRKSITRGGDARRQVRIVLDPHLFPARDREQQVVVTVGVRRRHGTGRRHEHTEVHGDDAALGAPDQAAHPCADLGVELAELGGVLEVVGADRRGRRGECADRALEIDVTERCEPAWLMGRVLRVLGPDPRSRQPADERRDGLGCEPRIVGEGVAQAHGMRPERGLEGHRRQAREGSTGAALAGRARVVL